MLLLQFIHCTLRLHLAMLVDVAASESALAVDLVTLQRDAVKSAATRQLGRHLHVTAHEDAVEHLREQFD